MPKTREEILTLLNGDNALENLKALLGLHVVAAEESS